MSKASIINALFIVNLYFIVVYISLTIYILLIIISFINVFYIMIVLPVTIFIRKQVIFMTINDLKDKVISGGLITIDDALFLSEADLDDLCKAADEIQHTFFGNDFDICAVVNVKGGKCSENCVYCSQSTCAKIPVKAHAMISPELLLRHARLRNLHDIRHYCLVSSGKRVSDKDIDKICNGIKAICRDTKLSVCTSFGLLGEEQFRKLKEAGVVRIHNNLETSRRYFPYLCTSHTYDEKIATIIAAKKAGLEVCSGGIFGVGETMKDRIDMAFTLRDLDVTSVPINLLNPIKGTPMGDFAPLTKEEILRITALYRFILPKQYIRLAAGRNYLPDSGFSCFKSGANATITGNMLTVKGISMDEDIRTIKEMGYKVI